MDEQRIAHATIGPALLQPCGRRGLEERLDEPGGSADLTRLLFSDGFGVAVRSEPPMTMGFLRQRMAAVTGDKAE